MTYVVRTFRADPGCTYGTVTDRTPYATRDEARAIRDQCVAMEQEARDNGERVRDWYLFDIQEVVPEQPVGGNHPVSADSTWAIAARAWARGAMKTVLAEIEREQMMAAMAAADEE
jgi:hypothetical protein